MLDEAGVRVEAQAQQFIVAGGQSFRLKSYTIPGDFSSASYPLAAAAVTGSEVTVKGVLPSRQGDSAIIDILRAMGAKVSWDREKGDLWIRGGELQGVEVDASRTPDLVPTIAVLGAVAKGKTTIVNAEHVRHKETDRLHAMAVELARMGADIRERPDGLEISGGRLHGAQVHGWDDHRIVMALTVARDANRYGRGGRCVLSGILPGDGKAGGEGGSGVRCYWASHHFFERMSRYSISSNS
ncbi:MAG: hypothetical protein LUQ21_00615 [Methanothrix sp.]|nr:hypothetical protein [Methanothrix sp.]